MSRGPSLWLVHMDSRREMVARSPKLGLAAGSDPKTLPREDLKGEGGSRILTTGFLGRRSNKIWPEASFKGGSGWSTMSR
jgi:hypothetical protein